jgi:multidrug efflux system outer membrane protein
MNSRFRYAVCSAAVVVAGCSLPPPYHRPEAEVPAAYHGPVHEATARSIADADWWNVFRDPKLDALIRDALAGNLDLAVVAAQITQAQAQVRAARSPIFPHVGGELSGQRGNDTPTFITQNSFLAALALSWESDVWGRYRSATEAARASLLATEEARRGIIASLVSGIAQQYLQLSALRQRLDIVNRTAAAQRDSLRLVKLLAEHGVQSATEVRQAETQVLTTENQLPAIERQLGQAENALSILLGKPPQSFDVAATLPADTLPPAVPPGLPSELLERRPDIRQAEQQLIAANANIGVARAQFFPSISLTGTLGRASEQLAGLVTAHGIDVHALGVAANVPIFQGGALVANEQIAQAQAQQATAQYRRTVLVALQEVSDALIAYDRDAAEVKGNRDRVAVAEEYLRLSNERFRAGVISYLEVLDAQRQLFSAQLDLNAGELSQRLDVVQLYKALGGGWTAS